jgi:hypothetical protein
VLLSGIKLPDIDGYTVARLGKTLRAELEVILMTGYAPSPLPGGAANAGVSRAAPALCAGYLPCTVATAAAT